MLRDLLRADRTGLTRGAPPSRRTSAHSAKKRRWRHDGAKAGSVDLWTMRFAHRAACRGDVGTGLCSRRGNVVCQAGYPHALCAEKGMPAERIAMHKIKELLRLKYECALSHERIARALSISKGVVAKYVKAAEASGLDRGALLAADEAELRRVLGAGPRPRAAAAGYVAPDLAAVHQGLKRKRVTLALLWEECAQAAGGPAYQYSRFCDLYREFARRLKRSTRQVRSRPPSSAKRRPPERSRGGCGRPRGAAEELQRSCAWITCCSPCGPWQICRGCHGYPARYATTNDCPVCRGITVQLPVEPVSSLVWNTHI
jgi:hypothetical protein